MNGLLQPSDPALLVGMDTADDAGVYRLNQNLALVETTDIITPLVDDPFTFGQIAAVNAISDVYAMGGKPVTVMNLVFFPACTLPMEALSRILAGGLSKVVEAGARLVGGHTVEDDELKYGLAVTGVMDPDLVVRNSTSRPGDRLVLTKPLGTGIVSTAIKADMAPESVVDEAAGWMITLNNFAAEAMLKCSASACTDVTGFGLIGHACEMARGAGVTIRLERASVPVMAGVMELIGDGLVPAGCYRNRDYYSGFVAAADAAADKNLPLFDPQTSGGLLVSLAPKDAARFLNLSTEMGFFAAEVGEVLPMGERPVEIIP